MGWLSEDVEATLAAWFNAHSTDDEGAVLAQHVMHWSRSTIDGNKLIRHKSIHDLLDTIEGPDEHRLHITETDWKMVHPLSCRMRGLPKCVIEPWPDLLENGVYALLGGEWVPVSSA